MSRLIPLNEYLARQQNPSGERPALKRKAVKQGSTVGAAPYRPDAYEYRNIPSRMGSTLKLPDGTEV